MDSDIATLPAPTPQRPRRRGGRLLTTAGVLLLVTGLAFMGWYIWDAYFNPVMDTKAAQQQVDQVKKEWAEGKKPSSKIPNQAIGLLRIPEFGPKFEVAIMPGVTPYDLGVGVGWFENTAKPGQLGNFAVAGHRGASGPFVPLLDLKPGARVIVETREATYVYAITHSASDLTVDKYQTWVINPVPIPPGSGEVEPAEPTKRMITLITCRNFFHSPERSVAFGELVETIRK